MLVAAIACLSTLCASAIDDPTKKDVDIIARAFEANRKGFPFGRIVFRESVGTAPNLKDAMEGKWTSRVETVGSCAFDGEKARFECVYTLEQLTANRRKIGPNLYESPIQSRRFLTDGKDTLFHNYEPALEGPGTSEISQIMKGASGFWTTWSLPIDLGKPEATTGVEAELRLIGLQNEKVDLRSIAKSPEDRTGQLLDIVFSGLSHHNKSDWKRETRYRVDLARGAIPIERRTEYTEPRRIVETVIQADLREVAGRGWFPHRKLVYGETLGQVREWLIVEADFDHPPPAAQFRLEFERPISIRDQVNGVDYEPSRSFDFDKRPPLQPGRATMIPFPGAPPSMPGERERSSSIGHYLMAALGVALLIMFWFVRRKA